MWQIKTAYIYGLQHALISVYTLWNDWIKLLSITSHIWNTESKLPFIGLFPKCQRQPGLGQVKAWRPELHSDLPHVWDPTTWAPVCLRVHIHRKLRWKQRSWDSNQALQYGIWVSQTAINHCTTFPSMSSPLLDSTCKWNHAVFVILCLIYFT